MNVVWRLHPALEKLPRIMTESISKNVKVVDLIYIVFFITIISKQYIWLFWKQHQSSYSYVLYIFLYKQNS